MRPDRQRDGTVVMHFATLVPAPAASGAKRMLTSKGSSSISLMPSPSPDGAGMSGRAAELRPVTRLAVMRCSASRVVSSNRRSTGPSSGPYGLARKGSRDRPAGAATHTARSFPAGAERHGSSRYRRCALAWPGADSPAWRKGVVVDMALAQPTADTAWRQAFRIRQQGGRLIRAVTHDAVHVVRQTKKAYRYPVRLSCFVRPRGCGYFIS